MRNPTADRAVVLVLGVLWAARYAVYLLLVPFLLVVWWETGVPGLVKLALVVFWGRLAVRSYRRLRLR